MPPYGKGDDVATFTTLTSLLSTAPQPGMRATALDAPGSMLYEVGGKWGGDLGVFANMPALNAISTALIADGTSAKIADTATLYIFKAVA